MDHLTITTLAGLDTWSSIRADSSGLCFGFFCSCVPNRAQNFRGGEFFFRVGNNNDAVPQETKG
jgi:hypothetical protein